MKIHRIWIDSFKNLRNCEVAFEQSHLLNAVIGGNGSGKSNLIEAILHVLLDTYLGKSPPFDFRFEYEAQGRHIELSCAATVIIPHQRQLFFPIDEVCRASCESG